MAREQRGKGQGGKACLAVLGLAVMAGLVIARVVIIVNMNTSREVTEETVDMTTTTTVQPIFSVEEVARELEYVTKKNKEMKERLEDLRGLTMIGIPILFLFSLIILKFVCLRGLESDDMKKKVQVLEKKTD